MVKRTKAGAVRFPSGTEYLEIVVSDNTHPLAEPFRDSLRGLASSVTIITTQFGAVRYGMVATAVMSLSLEPPSLVIAVNSNASLYQPLTCRRAFVVNILTERDEPIARGFTVSKGESRFAYGAWSSDHIEFDEMEKLPYLQNGQAAIFCRVTDVHASGSHGLFVGAVEHVIVGREKAPLVYCDGAYGALSKFELT
jgi:flavin reductase